MKSVTRIVTCFKQWHYIGMWLDDSRLFDDTIDWVIVNDAPEDHCPDWMLAVARERGVTLHNAPFNCGRSNQRNLGARLARGEWIDHIDGDDLPLPLDSSLLERVEHADLLTFPVPSHRLVNDRVATLDDCDAEPAYPGHFDSLGCESYPPLDPRPCSFMFRRKAFMRIGGYDARFDGAEDRHLLWKADRARLPLASLPVPKQSYLICDAEKPESLYIPLARARFLELLRDEHASVLPPRGRALLEHYYLEQMWRILGQLETLPRTRYQAREAFRRVDTTVSLLVEELRKLVGG